MCNMEAASDLVWGTSRGLKGPNVEIIIYILFRECLGIGAFSECTTWPMFTP